MIVLRQKIFFQSKATGEYFTGSELKDYANKLKAEGRNGSLKIYNSRGRRLNGATYKFSNPEALREAYTKKQLAYDDLPRDLKLNQLNKDAKTFEYLEKNGLVTDIKRYDDGVVRSFRTVKPKSPLMKRLSKLTAKGKRLLGK